jgi:hypothetical protein
VLAFAGLCACGDDAIIVNDDGISSGGVKLEAVNPERGSVLGGTSVLLEGSGLGGNNVVVAFGEVAATDVVVLSAEALLVVSPPGVDPGAVDIVVANAQGFAQRNVAYVYNDPPMISAVDPAEGPRVGGTTVTVTGTGFLEFEAGDTRVTFDGEPADGVEVVSDTQLTVTVPPGMPNTIATIDISNENGAAELPESYRYLANGLFASAGSLTTCGGNNAHPTALLFVDLDDNTIFDIGGDRPNGFTRLAADEEGGLVGLEACTQDLYQIDPQTGESTLLIDTAFDPEAQSPGHISGLLRDGNDYIVKVPGQEQTLGRLSLSSGQVTPIGTGAGSSSRRVDFARDGNLVFMIGSITIGQGISQIDLTSGNEIGNGVTVPFTVRGGAIHRGELFMLNRLDFGGGGKGGGGMHSTRIMRVDRATGASEFAAVVPTYLKGLVSGDL